jgi:hypothetical protein
MSTKSLWTDPAICGFPKGARARAQGSFRKCFLIAVPLGRALKFQTVNLQT